MTEGQELKPTGGISSSEESQRPMHILRAPPTQNSEQVVSLEAETSAPRRQGSRGTFTQIEGLSLELNGVRHLVLAGLRLA